MSCPNIDACEGSTPLKKKNKTGNAVDTGSLRPHTLVAQGRILAGPQSFLILYNSSLRPHALVA